MICAQYPTIPDSVNQRMAVVSAKWNASDSVAWHHAIPMVMCGIENGKPYVPWCENPSMLLQSDIPAFPGAEGGGKYSFGGRGGKVYVVTSLADSGKGTLREACEAGGPRIVVFNVAGEIHLNRPIHVKAPYISIYGQTAPDDGVVVTGQTIEVDTHDVIIRYMRFRRGAMDVAFRDDACGGQGIGNIIYDHCSASWGLDEVMSIYRHLYPASNSFSVASKPYAPKQKKLPTVNITIQDCIFAEGLDLYNHAFGASIGGHNTLFARNLFACNISRNPSIAMDGDFNFVNNVLFNWWNRSIDGGDDNSVYCIVNNYLKPGPVTGYDVSKGKTDKNASIRYRILKPESSRDKTRKDAFGKAYVNGNIVEGYESVTKNNWDGGVQPSYNDVPSLLQRMRLEVMPVTFEKMLTATEAYDYVMKNVGATKPCRDAVDQRIISSVKTGKPQYAKNAVEHESPYVKRRLPADSYKLGIITDPQQVGGLPIYKGIPRLDSDGDGMPDEWESANGLNPMDASDAMNIREDGYMNIEYYANSL
ncbi:MAG: polysaccharide lyase [Prevotella sp.]|nr:polysaccharide lyase [Candidatus Prevotella equi]